MNWQYVAAAAMAAAFIIIGICVFAPEVADKLPGIDTEVYATVNVAVSAASNDVIIINVTLNDRVSWTMIRIGPLITTWQGRLVFESYNSAGTLVDSREVEWIQSGWTPIQYSGDVRLGPTGSGTYSIKVSMYDKNNLLLDKDQTSRTI